MRALLILLALFVVTGSVARADQRWIVITDIHLDPYNRNPGVERGRDTNVTLWQLTLRRLRDERPPDVVVLSGDFLAHEFSSLARDNGDDPKAAAVRTMRNIATALQHTFPRAQFLIALGNNDDPCGDYASEAGGPYEHALAATFAPLVDKNGAAPNFMHDFERGGYYTARLPGGARAIVVNSVFWSFVYRGGCGTSTRGAGADELTWLRKTLNEPQRSVLVMHVPLGFDPLSTTDTHRFLAVPFVGESNGRAILRMLADAPNRVTFAIAGHTHRYDFRIASGVPMLIASSVSPVYRNNPAFYDLDVAPNGTLRDVVPVTYDPWEGTWQREPSFDSMYGVDGFTGPNLARASERIALDPAVRAKWIQAYDVWSYRMGDISDHRWRVYWCAQTELGGGYASCAGTQNRTVAVVFVALGVAAAVTLLLVFLVRRLFSVRR